MTTGDSETDNQKSVTKTLTFGLGVLRGYDRKADSFIELSDEQRKRIYTEIPKGFYDFARLCNFTTSIFYVSKVLDTKLEKLGFNTGYNPIREKMGLDTHLNGKVLSQAFGLSKAHFAGEHGKSLMRTGENVLPTHKWNGTHPLQFHKDAVRLRKVDGKFFIVFNLFEDKWAKGEKLPSWVAFQVVVKRRDKTMEQQLERVIAGEWDQKSGRILRSSRIGGRRYLGQVTVGYIPSSKPLCDNVVMGIDLGVSSPAAVHIREGDEGARWAMLVGNGRQMLEARRIIMNEIKRLVRALRTKNSPLTGPAREIALRRLRDLRKRERRVMKTASQRLAKQIRGIAEQNGAGIWRMEDLSGDIKDESPWLRRNWAPGALKDALRWQADQVGAKLEFVDPRYTSQRCSTCGHIDPANRPKGKKGQAEFKCTACGYEEHADKNAARNISTPGIEQLISKRLGE